jgi:hypothetical protein
MKTSFVLLFLFSVSILFAQQTPNSWLKKKSSTDLLLPNTTKYSLNLTPFKLEDFQKVKNPISELLQKSDNRRLKPIDNMPIFEPQGKFFLEIYEVEQDIDHKLRIFQFEQSKYYLRSVG